MTFIRIDTTKCSGKVLNKIYIVTDALIIEFAISKTSRYFGLSSFWEGMEYGQSCLNRDSWQVCNNQVLWHTSHWLTVHHTPVAWMTPSHILFYTDQYRTLLFIITLPYSMAYLSLIDFGLHRGAHSHCLNSRLPNAVLHWSNLSSRVPSKVPVELFSRMSKFARVTPSSTYIIRKKVYELFYAE